MTSECVVSVILGFKNWGLERLSITLSHLVPQTLSIGGEVIVVDYGSDAPDSIEAVVSAHGARVVRVENGNPWSRSRAMNAGVAASTGRYLITTDADMLFTPNSIAKIVDRLARDRNRTSVLQCKDLPPAMDAGYFQDRDIEWEKLETAATYRPRYGMGGMIAFTRSAFLAIRGFDERMHTYGGEDLDFAHRLRRSGMRFDWIDDSEVSIYHIWHPSSRAASEDTQGGSAAIANNSRILEHDKSYIRNTVSWRFRPAEAKPLAAIVIVSRDRLHFLKESIASVFMQTVKDIQIIVVDDGSNDGTWDFIKSIDDPRFLALRQEAGGIAAARNLATSHVEADWILVHDDDDIMLPTRVEDHFNSLEAGCDGNYGGWIDFEDTPGGKIQINPGREFDPDAVRFLGGVYLHGTLMVKKEYFELVPYDITYRSGSDFNLAVRLMRSGITLKHTGAIAMLRRLHPKQVTHADSSYQRASWSITKQFAHPSASMPQIKFKRRQADKGTAVDVIGADKASTLLRTYGTAAFSKRDIAIQGGGRISESLLARFKGFSLSPIASTLEFIWYRGSISNGTLTDALELILEGFEVHFLPKEENDSAVGSAYGALTTYLSQNFQEGNFLIGQGVAPEDMGAEAFKATIGNEEMEVFICDVEDLELSLLLDFVAASDQEMAIAQIGKE